MTTILADDFNSLANWAGSGSLVTGRTGTGMQVSGSSTATYTIPAGPLRTVGETARFSYRTNSIAVSRGICTFSVGVSNTLTVKTTTTGAVSVLLGGVGGAVIGTSAAGLIAINTWYTIEIAVHIADAPNGMVVVKVDGTERLRLTGVDTLSTSSPILDNFVFNGNGSGTTSIFDDFLLTDDDPTIVRVKVWNGTAYVDAPVKVWTGSAYVGALAVKTWTGSAWA